MSVNEHVLGNNSSYLRLSPRATLAKVRAQRRRPQAAFVARLLTALFMVCVTVTLAMAWSIRAREYLVAKEGLGYYLGIIGGVLLLLQFLYPLRKNLRFMRHWGTVKHWFYAHKMLGVLGPLLIVLHSNFKLHAINSNVALFSMLVVVASGLVGRYLYAKLHSSHHGELLTLQGLQEAFGISRDAMDQDLYIDPRVKEHLHTFEDEVFLPEPGFWKGFWNLLTLGQRTRHARARAYREVKDTLYARALRDGWSEKLLSLRQNHDRELIRFYLRGVSRVVEFRFYSRLFGLWHTLHIPLFVMLVLTGVVHVVAVHMY